MSLFDTMKELSEEPLSCVVFISNNNEAQASIINDAFRVTSEGGGRKLLKYLFLLWIEATKNSATEKTLSAARQIFGELFLNEHRHERLFFALHDGERYSRFTVRLCPLALTADGSMDDEEVRQAVLNSPVFIMVRGHPKAISAHLDALEGLAEKIN